MLVVARAAAAQLAPAPEPVNPIEDARVLPPGTLRLRALNAWSRYDQLYGGAPDSSGRLRPLGANLNVQALGVAQIPSLAAAQSALRTLTGNAALSLSLGNLVATADARIVTTPLSLEYGATRHLTFGATLPIVQSRTTVFVELNPRRLVMGPVIGSTANVGPNPAFFAGGSAAALQQNQAVYAQLTAAIGQLQSALQSCSSNPSGSVCQRRDEAEQLLQTSNAVAQALVTLYGIDTQSGSPVVPMGDAASAVAARLGALDQQYQSLLGAGAYVTSRPAAAAGRAALGQLQGVLTAPNIGLDSLGSPESIGIGDVELRAKYQLFDSFADTAAAARGGPRLRAAVQAAVRLPTGRTATGNVPFAVGTGMHQTALDGGAVLDIRPIPRVMATLMGRYTAYVGGAPVARVPGAEYSLFPLDSLQAATWRAGNVIQAGVLPRLLITDYLSLNGAYELRRQAASTYTLAGGGAASGVPPLFAATRMQRVGIGFEYSTLARYARGRTSVPLELSFTHLETVHASGGVAPKLSQDWIELRIYYRLLRGAR